MLVIAALVFGVVTMHAMSGSSGSHAPVPTIGSMAPADATPITTGAGHGAGSHGADSAGVERAGASISPTEDDGAHGLMTAMCLMVLVSLMAIGSPRRRLGWGTAPSSGGRDVLDTWTKAAHRARPPRLVELGISRT